jgi:CheY-like chemotaxis protein
MRDDPLRGRTVLVVEDDEEYREILQRLVASLGARVLTASNGLNALRHMDLAPPDLILCDLTMPIMDGLAFARQMRAHPRYRRTLLVAVTARGGESDLVATWSAGFNAHLVKPVTFEALRVIARRLSGAATDPRPAPSRRAWLLGRFIVPRLLATGMTRDVTPHRGAVGEITQDPQLEAEHAVVTHGTPFPSPGVIPRDEAIDVGQPAAGDPRLDAGDLVVHVECREARWLPPHWHSYCLFIHRAMDPERQSISEAGAYRIVEMVLRDLEAAARILGNREAVTPDPERALHLEAIRSAIADLRTVAQPWPASDA